MSQPRPPSHPPQPQWTPALQGSLQLENHPSSSPTPTRNPNQPNRFQAHGRGAREQGQRSLDPTEHRYHPGINRESAQRSLPSHPIADNSGDGHQAHKSHRPGDEMVTIVSCRPVFRS